MKWESCPRLRAVKRAEWMPARKSIIDLKVVIFREADPGIYYMPGTVLGMNQPGGTLQLCHTLP